ncbi:site-specific integrase [Roseomonas sp. ACRSG]|nr:site-specific integrase [Roseomonas sp. ACRSG]
MDRAFDGALAQARAAVTAGNGDLNAILRAYLKESLERHLTTSIGPSGAVPMGLRPLGMLEMEAADTRDALAARDYRHFNQEVDALLERHGLSTDLRDSLGIGVIEAQLQVLQEAIRRAKGEVSLVFPAEAPAPSAPLASSLVEPYFQHRLEHDGLSHHDMGQERSTLRRFMEVCGDRPVDRYGRGDMTRFMDTLRRLPTNYGKSPKDKDRTLADIIAEADTEGAERIAERTVKRHLSALTVFFRYAVDRGHLTNSQRVELAGGHRFKASRKSAKAQRDAWTSEELTALFASPAWTGCLSAHFRSKPGPNIIRDSKYWLPLLALFHGARLEELADLYGRDVRQVEGIWTLHITETLDKPEGGRRRLKTSHAERLIPLHPELQRLGFVTYVQETAPGGDDPVFPDLEPQGKDRRRGPRVTRWFQHYRKQVGLYREGVAHHSFRHTAITRLTEAITDYQQVRHRDYLMGHSAGGGEGSVRYDKGPGLGAVAETLGLLRFPEVKL